MDFGGKSDLPGAEWAGAPYDPKLIVNNAIAVGAWRVSPDIGLYPDCHVIEFGPSSGPQWRRVSESEALAGGRRERRSPEFGGAGSRRLTEGVAWATSHHEPGSAE